MPNGWIITIAALAPNLLWMVIPSPHMPPAERDKDRFTKEVAVIEWIGRIGIFAIPLFCSVDITDLVDKIAALVMLGSLGLYYTGWARYFINGRDYRFLYEDLLKIPFPLALCPVIYFGAASIVLRSIVLAIAVVIFGVVHIYLIHQEAQQYGL